MKKERWLWILGWFSFLLVALALTNEMVYSGKGYSGNTWTLFVMQQFLWSVLNLVIFISIFVLIKLIVIKFCLRKYKFNFFQFFKSLFLVNSFEIFLYLFLDQVLIGFCSSMDQQELLSKLLLPLFLVTDFWWCRRNFKKIVSITSKNSLIWNWKILGMVIIANLTFILVFSILLKLPF